LGRGECTFHPEAHGAGGAQTNTVNRAPAGRHPRLVGNRSFPALRQDLRERRNDAQRLSMCRFAQQKRGNVKSRFPCFAPGRDLLDCQRKTHAAVIQRGRLVDLPPHGWRGVS